MFGQRGIYILICIDIEKLPPQKIAQYKIVTQVDCYHLRGIHTETLVSPNLRVTAGEVRRSIPHASL